MRRVGRMGLAALAAMVSCSDGTQIVDSPGHDAGQSATLDAGSVPDAGALDAGSGEPDAGAIDAGGIEEPFDAGTFDAGAIDAGFVDAGAVDAGVVDAGVVDAGTPPNPADFVRFVALGDAGKGNSEQYAVGAAMKSVCDAKGGCAFAVYLGDNFYPTGVSGVEDAQWQTSFELPYQALTFPFHAVLGNHDYGGNGAGYEIFKAQNEVDYTGHGNKWSMPAKHYAFTGGPIDFVVLDTNAILWGYGDDQAQAMPGRLAAMTRPWKFAMGHHPFHSNGPHGNAGKYDDKCVPVLGCTCDSSALAIPCGKKLEPFLTQQVCGKFDFYLSGHDHSLQHLHPSCGVNLVVSGGGASTTDLPGSNANYFQSDVPGFFLFEVTPQKVVLEAFDSAGVKKHHAEVVK